MALTVILNGSSRVFAGLNAPSSVADVVGELGLQTDRVAVEWNGEIVSRAAWRDAAVGDGDKLEVVHFVGGGSGLG